MDGFKADLPFVRFHHSFYEIETKARANGSLADGIIGAEKFFKNTRLLLFWDADAGILNAHGEFLFVPAVADVDGPAVFGIFHGVAHEIHEG
ncbi:MAG TPA: hypothetical protein VI588_01220, partial [Candidatus Gracilibacteria bacterium]|nr:hypothetical protein [Candidatus Gracilibacteria bacterium]